MYVAAIVPTIDEADTIGELVRALDKICDRVIVVDGSPVAYGVPIPPFGHNEVFRSVTAVKAEEAGAAVTLVYNGLGPAYRAGGWSVNTYRDGFSWHVAHIDAGGSHDPADLYPMLDLAEEGFDVVIGSRFCLRGQHLGTWQRRFTSKLASAALNHVCTQGPQDWTSGYRVYSPRARAILAKHDFTTTGHAWQIESLWTLIHAGMRIVETPITYRPSASQLSAGRVREAISLYWRLAWR